METDQRGLITEEKEEEETSYKKQKITNLCLTAKNNGGRTKSYDECGTSTSCKPKAKISSVGISRRKSGRYAARIRDPITRKEVWLGTFDTAEQASQAYFSKKSEFEKLSQQEKRENKSNKHCDQIHQPESPSVVACLPVANDQNLDIIRTHKRKMSGKYTSEIMNPITKKKIWLGIFDTAEEASRAYQFKKLEFQKLVNAKQQQLYAYKQTRSKQVEKSEKLANVKQGHENQNCELKSAGGSGINVPISNSYSGETDQRINSHKIGSAEEAFQAYLSKKFDSHSSKVVELQSNMSTDSSAGKEKQEGQEDDKDLWLGQWIQFPGNREVMFSLKLGLPIIDNYGSLLGEFSSLDDLSIT